MKRLLPLLLCVGLAASATQAQSVAAENPAHDELRVLRTHVIDAITKGDIETVLKYVHPDVVVTWQNSDVCRGTEGLRDFFHRTGKDAFKGYKVPPTPDELTILHGDDFGVSFGKVVAQYSLLGNDFEFTSRWTATLVKEEGRWLLASYHVSLNALDNPLINAAKKSLIWIAVAAGVAGIIFGMVIGRRRKA